ncbi:hypothetical protein H8E07_10975 [bacterium]|nr:hypothetical protein [bacterium]
MNLALLLDLTTLLANTATVVGIPIAILVFVRDRRSAQQTREEETYGSLQDKYSEFLEMCLARPELGLHDYDRQSAENLPPELKRQRMIAFELLTSMFERAFFFYGRGHDSGFLQRQWTGWEEFMRDWARRSDYREAWQEHLDAQFDADFILYMNRLMKEAHPRDR